MKALRQAVGDYLALRRSLGFKLTYHEHCLREFISFVKKNRSRLWLAEILSAENGIDPFSPKARTLSLHLIKSSSG